MTVVLCSGISCNYAKNKNINKVSELKLKKNNFIFHAGTKIVNNEIVSSGEILNFTAMGNSFFKIRKEILRNIKKFN